MDGLLDQVGSVVGDVLNSVPVRLLVFGTIAYVTVVWFAAAHWVLRDMRRRRQDPVSPYLGALGIVLASPLLLPISAFTYLVLRPKETIAETRERELTERLEAIGAESALACPGCRRAVEEDWLTCPACRTRLARRCARCSRTMGLDWSLCGFCGAEFGRPVVAQRVPAAVRGGLLEARAGNRAARTAAAVPAASREATTDPRRAERPDRRGQHRTPEQRVPDARRELLEPNA